MSRTFRRPLPRIALSLCSALIVACGGDSTAPGDQGPYPLTNVPPPPNGVAQFSVLPVAIAPGLTLTALGNLNPPGHVLPTDHVYFYDWDLSAHGGTAPNDVRDVVMPAAGAVFFIIRPTGTDYKVAFRATTNFYFYLDHVLLTQPLTVGQVIQAGTTIGQTAAGGTLDLGAFDMTVMHSGFMDTTRYGAQTLHYVSPWTYFTPALQTQITPHLYRIASAFSLDSRIDFGIAGKLSGDWFLQGMPRDSSGGPYGWTRSLSFAYDYFDPSQVRISVGGTIGPAGVWTIEASAPRPETVTTASGVVAYKLYSPFDPGFPPYGLLLVQMVDAATIRAELFVGSVTATQFDASAVTFVR